MALGLAAAFCIAATSSCPAAEPQTEAAGKPATVPQVAYLFSCFINNGEDGLHLAWSADGLNWPALNGGKSYITPKVGESKLMRDPCLVLCPDGMFRMVWTTSWGGRTIGYASSKDLITWSEQQAIPVGEADKTDNCWAPELFYVEVAKQYIIIADSQWSEDGVFAYVATQANCRLGNHPDSMLAVDESSFTKKGDHSAGVGRQYSGRQGKIDNCQVGVFTSLCNGPNAMLVGARLLLPDEWVKDPKRCRAAGIPDDRIKASSKTDLARELIVQADDHGIQYARIGMDSFYGRDSSF